MYMETTNDQLVIDEFVTIEHVGEGDPLMATARFCGSGQAIPVRIVYCKGTGKIQVSIFHEAGLAVVETVWFTAARYPELEPK